MPSVRCHGCGRDIPLSMDDLSNLDSFECAICDTHIELRPSKADFDLEESPPLPYHSFEAPHPQIPAIFYLAAWLLVIVLVLVLIVWGLREITSLINEHNKRYGH